LYPALCRKESTVRKILKLTIRQDKMKMNRIITLSALAVMSSVAYADEPNVPSAAPYIVLSDNIDEPNGYGFCLDTLGAGQTDLMQTHSCKPHKDDEPRDYEGFDTRFSYNSDTGQIEAYAFEGFCMQALISNTTAVFALLECSDHARQKFVFDESAQTLHPQEDKESCVTVASVTEEAGPWVKRSLMMQNCVDVDASLKQWTVVSE